MPVGQGTLAMDHAMRQAFRAGDLDFVFVGRQGMRIDEPPADEEDEYFPGAGCHTPGVGTTRYTGRILVTFCAMVTVHLVSTHDGFLLMRKLFYFN
jgi:hypothetical protein